MQNEDGNSVFMQGSRPAGRVLAGRRFTLVEMLVVIALIAILAGLLLPALRGALDAAKKVACLNQMRQIGVEVNEYAGTYHDRVPLYFSWGDRKRNNVVWIVNSQGIPTKAGFSNYGKLYYGGWMRMPQVYYCPCETAIHFNDRSSANYNAWPPGRWGEPSCPPAGVAWAAGKTSVTYGTRPVASEPGACSNWWTLDGASPPRLAKYASKTILAEITSTNNVANRHGTGMNVLRGDGSGHWVMLDRFYVNLFDATGDVTNTTTLNSGKLLTTSSTGADTGVWADFDQAK